MNIFDGLHGYESVLLVCGFVLFVFALAMIAAMLMQRRGIKMLVALLPVSIAMMGFPGIQSIKFGNDLVEIDRARAQPDATMTATQKQQLTNALTNVQQRSSDNPQLQAKVADGYRVIGELDKAYNLAQAVMAKHPSPATSKILVPVLTAKLKAATTALPPAGTVGTSAAAPRQVAQVASQLQTLAQAAPLPADSHVALATAYARLGEPERAKTNAEAALRIDPRVKFNPTLESVIRHPVAPRSTGGH